jgi:hypothetical protein
MSAHDHTTATRIPEAGIFIAVLSNVGGGADPHVLANRIASAVLARELFPA